MVIESLKKKPQRNSDVLMRLTLESLTPSVCLNKREGEGTDEKQEAKTTPARHSCYSYVSAVFT